MELKNILWFLGGFALISVFTAGVLLGLTWKHVPPVEETYCPVTEVIKEVPVFTQGDCKEWQEKSHLCEEEREECAEDLKTFITPKVASGSLPMKKIPVNCPTLPYWECQPSSGGGMKRYIERTCGNGKFVWDCIEKGWAP